MTSTDLVFTKIGLGDYCARGVTETKEPIDEAANLARDVNGNLLDLSNPAFQKWRFTWSGDDLDFPAAGGMWPGMEFTVTPLVNLASGGTGATGATGSGSVNVRLKSLRFEYDEWGAAKRWQITAEQK